MVLCVIECEVKVTLDTLWKLGQGGVGDASQEVVQIPLPEGREDDGARGLEVGGDGQWIPSGNAEETDLTDFDVDKREGGIKYHCQFLG